MADSRRIWRRDHRFGHVVLWVTRQDLATTGQVLPQQAEPGCPLTKFGQGMARSSQRWAVARTWPSAKESAEVFIFYLLLSNMGRPYDRIALIRAWDMNTFLPWAQENFSQLTLILQWKKIITYFKMVYTTMIQIGWMNHTVSPYHYMTGDCPRL